jgi:hypothetical protein
VEGLLGAMTMGNLNEFCYTSHGHDNWFYSKYYYAGSNCRYFTFQLVMNMLASLGRAPVIVETGCQRMAEDLGAGMSTSIWGEFCQRLGGGEVHTVEISAKNLEVCRQCTQKWAAHIHYNQGDSVAWLASTRVGADLLYLDSMDYDYVGLLNRYGGQVDTEAAINVVNQLSLQDVLSRHADIVVPAQEHCLNELKAAFASGLAHGSTIIMIDDNQLPGGGKSRLAKDHLATMGWTCLLDFQQSVWVKK